MLRATLLGALFVLVLPDEASAAMRTVTLDQAVTEAHDSNPAALAVRAGTRAQVAETRVPRALWYPTVGALLEIVGATTNNSTATILSNQVLDLPRIGATPVGRDPNWSPSATTLAAVGARQQVYDFGRIGSQIALADTVLLADRERERALILDVEVGAAFAYYDVLAAKAVVTAAAQAVQRAQARREYVVAGITRGMRPAIERERVDADVQRFEVARIRSEGTLVNARTNLAIAIGADEDQVDADEHAPAALDVAPLPADVASQVMDGDPLIREARLRAEAKQREADAVRAASNPSLFFTGALSGRAGGARPSSGALTDGNGFIPNVPNWSVALVLQIPIFDAALRARADATQAAEHALRERTHVVEQQIVAVARRALTNLEVARDALPALERARDAARGNYEKADARFRAGLGTSLELADAETLRVDAEIQYAIGHYDLARARLSVTRALAQEPSGEHP